MSSDRKINVPFPIGGIDVNSENDLTNAKYIENLLLGTSGDGKIRYGTYLSSELVDTATRLYNEISHGSSFLKQDGTSENILYIKYFEKIPYLNFVDNVEILANAQDTNLTNVYLNIEALTEEQQQFLTDRIFNDVKIYVSQINLPFSLNIFDILVDEGALISFTVDAQLVDFNTQDGANNFELWYERAGIYKEGDIDPLIDDLDANTIVSSLNYKNKLIICNGIDPVITYNGETIQPLLSNAFVATTGEILINASIITIQVFTNIKAEYVENLKVNSWIKFVYENSEQENIITNIIFTDIANNITTITITCQNPPLANTKIITYKKAIPRFSYIALAHNRLWALAEGRPFKDKFRSPNLTQTVYYAAIQDSIDGWFDEKTANINFINLADNNKDPENLEVIRFFQGKVLFIGRHTTQLWSGVDPDSNFDGQEINFGKFYFEKIFPIGILQRNLCQEMPNNLSMISNYGKAYSFHMNKYGQIDIAENFTDPVGNFFEMQLGFIENDNDYREMTSFLYPYSNLMGIKIKNECVIYQIKNKGFWTIFTENFSQAKSFFYNHINKNLYLGMNKGTLLCYADKIENQIFADYDIVNKGSKKIIWRLVYNWLYLDQLWINDKIDLFITSLKPITVNVKVCENNNETEPIDDRILIDQKGSLLDVHNFYDALFSEQRFEYAYETIKFKGLSFSLEFNGFVDDYFIFKKAVLSGGINADK